MSDDLVNVEYGPSGDLQRVEFRQHARWPTLLLLCVLAAGLLAIAVLALTSANGTTVGGTIAAIVLCVASVWIVAAALARLGPWHRLRVDGDGLTVSSLGLRSIHRWDEVLCVELRYIRVLGGATGGPSEQPGSHSCQAAVRRPTLLAVICNGPVPHVMHAAAGAAPPKLRLHMNWLLLDGAQHEPRRWATVAHMARSRGVALDTHLEELAGRGIR